MRVVVDANILAAALLHPGGWTATQLDRNDVTFVVPEQAGKELQRYLMPFALRAGSTADSLTGRLSLLLGRCEIIGEKRLRRFSRNRLVQQVAAIDAADAWYVACVFAAKADFLWTRDKALLEALPGVAVPTPP